MTGDRAFAAAWPEPAIVQEPLARIPWYHPVALVDHIQRFLFELDTGLAFVGRQVPLEVGDRHFVLDLLFYHLKLRCYVVVELRSEEHTSEPSHLKLSRMPSSA